MPLAYWSFQKETQVVDGKEVRGNPRLAHGGSHLKQPEREWRADIAARSFQGALIGMLAGIAIAVAAAALIGRKHGGLRLWLSQIGRGATDIPWRPMLITVIVMAMVIGRLAALWPYYHVFGTDSTGNDVLYQALKSIRTAFVIGTLATIATLPLASCWASWPAISAAGSTRPSSTSTPCSRRCPTCC